MILRETSEVHVMPLLTRRDKWDKDSIWFVVFFPFVCHKWDAITEIDYLQKTNARQANHLLFCIKLSYLETFNKHLFLNVFESLFFDQKHSKIVKYYYNLKYFVFSVWIYVKM